MQRKVYSGGLAGAVSVLVVWAVSLAGVEVPAEVASAFTTIVSVVIAWWVPQGEWPASGDVG